ncbi:transposase [Acidovorax sp. 93]|jgi:transposase|nr:MULTISPECIES: IS66 family transposase [unclassified Acidovorax]MCT6717106.1 IS66 family transposase [Acidovorax sp. K2F]OGA58003.1 MAG: transposase [Burkholderiales bacterium RIFCSPHIGHO2_01_FULL_64_960]RKR29603.1 transposase [Acidovorax sp. 93]
MVAQLQSLDGLSAVQLRELTVRLAAEVKHKQALIDKLTNENALLKRMKFAAQSERFSAEQFSLLDGLDIEDLACESEAPPAPTSFIRSKLQPKRQHLPPSLPRREILHDPQSTVCQCGCQMRRVGQDVAEKLDYTPGVFTVERHIRGKWACKRCERLVQAPVAAHIIDKGIPTSGLLAHVLVAKFADHLPLYRQEAIFSRAGYAVPRSTLAQWVGSCGAQLQPLVDALRDEVLSHAVLHADETPVAMLKPGIGKTHRAYLWAYAPGAFEDTRAVIYDFCDSRAGIHARTFLQGWQGSLVCDDFSGYKALMGHGVTEVGCWAHARRKFFDLHAASKSLIAESALQQFGRIYEVERDLHTTNADERLLGRQARSKPLLEALHLWMVQMRHKVPEGSATARAIDYSLKRWAALTRFVFDGRLPIDNNHIENQIRPIAIGRNNWLFAGSLRAGRRAAAIMTLIQTAKLNGHDPYAYLKDILERLPSHRANRVTELLPHRWGS